MPHPTGNRWQDDLVSPILLRGCEISHHLRVVANVDPVKPINGKKFIIFCGIGVVVFTVVMGFGTYALAHAMAPYLDRPAAKATAGKAPVADSQTPQ